MNTKILRQKILDLAIRGRLVPQDPNDEPAAVLLQRIHEEKQRLVKEKKLKKKDLETSPIAEEDIPFQLPQGWEWCRLCSIVSSDCTLGYGIVQPMDDVPDGIPLVRPVDLVKPIIGKEGLKRVDRSISEAYKRTILKGGEILFCVRASVGKTSIASSELCGANVTRGISPIWFDYEILTRYVFYLFQSTTSLKEIKAYAKGATLQQINVEDLKKLLIPLPPLSEQRRIVSAVEKWMSVIDALETSAADLQQFTEIAKKRILDLAIRGKLVEKEGEWEEKTLGEVAIYINGRAFKPTEWEDAGKPIIRIQNLNDPNAKYNYSSKEHESKYLIQKGDLLFAWAASLGTYIWDGQDAWLNQHIFKVIPHDFIEKRFLNLALDAMIASLYTRSHGSGMVHITKAEFIKTPIFVPPLSEQRRIVSKVEDLFAAIDTIAQAVV